MNRFSTSKKLNFTEEQVTAASMLHNYHAAM